MSPPQPEFVQASPREAEEIQTIAQTIWREVYPEIISAEQIEYMLAEMYAPEVIRADIEAGKEYFWITLESERAGFLAVDNDEGRDALFIDKLYLAPSHHGQGIGQRALSFAANHGRERGRSILSLRVNRNNDLAIRAYKRAGFKTVGELCVQIGGGFEMDDYWMECPITN